MANRKHEEEEKGEEAKQLQSDWLTSGLSEYLKDNGKKLELYKQSKKRKIQVLDDEITKVKELIDAKQQQIQEFESDCKTLHQTREKLERQKKSFEEDTCEEEIKYAMLEQLARIKSTSCAICLKPVLKGIAVPPCGHILHSTCFTNHVKTATAREATQEQRARWKDTHIFLEGDRYRYVECPTCRKPLMDPYKVPGTATTTTTTTAAASTAAQSSHRYHPLAVTNRRYSSLLYCYE
eukprot:TRINITY_DN16752_c0_g1_i1.p1 TRINITY_DN16752_c0_g1~~TRINITY_DN16752_c0_g1_i1.p1  ORF type:complete len:250 (-),score=51.05 TRINITY_DN16752_c0_g1_i1:35-745(-)